MNFLPSLARPNRARANRPRALQPARRSLSTSVVVVVLTAMAIIAGTPGIASAEIETPDIEYKNPTSATLCRDLKKLPASLRSGAKACGGSEADARAACNTVNKNYVEKNINDKNGDTILLVSITGHDFLFACETLYKDFSRTGGRADASIIDTQNPTSGSICKDFNQIPADRRKNVTCKTEADAKDVCAKAKKASEDWWDTMAPYLEMEKACNSAFSAGMGKFTLKTDNAQRIINGLALFALLTAVGGICISASLWAMGAKGQNQGQELTGKRGIVLCCTAAFFIGALPAIITYSERSARTADDTGASEIYGVQPLSYREVNGDNGCTESRAINDIDGPCANK